MSEPVTKGKDTVAIIGSGPAGHFAAYALQSNGYKVTVFEKEDHLSLAGHSYHLNSTVINIPMRTFSGKYYANWFQFLNHLRVPIQTHRFKYVFMKGPQQYFQFCSNFHRVLPCLEHGILLAVYLLLCYVGSRSHSFCFLHRSPVIPTPVRQRRR